MKILAVSDVELSFIYSPIIAQRFKDADLVISCGDLPYYYLEYIISMLNVPLYYVYGNHQNLPEIHADGERVKPWGAIHLHRHNICGPGNLLMTGIDGSLQYNFGPYQYSQAEMWGMVLLLVPGLIVNKLRFGRYLDVFVTHAPPWKIHDMDDRPHLGIKAFAWFDRVFQPAYHLHGHIHVYRQDTITETLLGKTKIINAFGYKELQVNLARPKTGQARDAREKLPAKE
jgi:Icc-related predicted phosphoesterase